MNKILTLAFLSAATLLITSCGNSRPPTTMSGDRGLTTGVHVDSSDVQVVTSRVTGKSTGFKILGFIPIKFASETEAVVNMYEEARRRGCPPEGAARQFVNNSVEHSANYFILFSYPVVRATGDLIQILPPGHGISNVNDGNQSSKPKKKSKRR